MHLKLGRRAAPADAADLLLECHARIRHFSELACKLGSADRPAEAEVREAATAVRRYFELALPLHVADEEESIAPRLRGRDAALDAALLAMSGQHEQHVAGLAELVAICAELEAAPEQLRERRSRLAELALALQAAFEEHMKGEEEIVIPALRQHLAAAEQELVLEEIRRRRR